MPNLQRVHNTQEHVYDDVSILMSNFPQDRRQQASPAHKVLPRVSVTLPKTCNDPARGKRIIKYYVCNVHETLSSCSPLYAPYHLPCLKMYSFRNPDHKIAPMFSPIYTVYSILSFYLMPRVLGQLSSPLQVVLPWPLPRDHQLKRAQTCSSCSIPVSL